MSLKIKTAARLKALFAGVALSKKSVDAIGDQLAKAGLTDESTDEEIDVKLNERNALFSFEDQKKFDDYQVGKATKEAADKEAKRIADASAGKPEEVELPADTPPWMKTFIEAQAASNKALQDQIAAITGEKVTNTRKEQYAKALEGTSEAFKTKALKDFSKMKFENDEDFNGFLTEATEDAKGFIQEESNSGLGGDRPNGGTGGNTGKGVKEASAAEVDAAVNSII